MEMRVQVILAAMAVCLLVMAAALVKSWPRQQRKPDPRVAVRPRRHEVIRIPERQPGAGLAWSRAQYPAQYSDPANLSQTDMRGLDDRAGERFLDIGGRAYSREFLSHFSYTDPAFAPRVTVTWLKNAETLTGRITGIGLKPNFAYQMKLRGIFSDRAAFERIGRVGRWRLPGTGTNYRDADYDKFPNKDQVESYLLFDYFVSDPQGKVDKAFYADSTLHVLWSVSHQRLPRITDTPARRFDRAGTDRRLYANPLAELTPQWLFAESEQHALGTDNRPAACEAFLPPGHYTVELVFTEESFHGYGDNGFWPTVMAAPLEFEVVDQPRPAIGWTATSEIAALSFDGATLRDIAVKERSPALLAGEATTGQAAFLIAEALRLPAQGRLALALEMKIEGTHQWQVFLDTPAQSSDHPSYVVDSVGSSGWQTFELEITGNRAATRLSIAPTSRKGAFAIRNMRIVRIVE